MTDVEIRVRDSEPQIGLEALDVAESVAFQMLTFVAGVFKDQKARKSAYAFVTKITAQRQAQSDPTQT
jgi:hypothetical protein